MLTVFVYQAGIPDPPAMSADLVRQKARERQFLEQLLDSKKLENYKIPVPIKAELRKYQQVCSLLQATYEGCLICFSLFSLSCLLASYECFHFKIRWLSFCHRQLQNPFIYTLMLHQVLED